MKQFDFEHQGSKFKAYIEYDDDTDPPWERSDCHGVITDWVKRDKHFSERLLISDGYSKRFYDFEASFKQATRQGWGLDEKAKADLKQELGYDPGPKLIIHQAVEKDFEFLRSWWNEKWYYVGVCVTRAGINEDERYNHAVWGIESNSDESFFLEVAKDLAEDIRNEDWTLVKNHFGLDKSLQYSEDDRAKYTSCFHAMQDVGVDELRSIIRKLIPYAELQVKNESPERLAECLEVIQQAKKATGI